MDIEVICQRCWKKLPQFKNLVKGREKRGRATDGSSWEVEGMEERKEGSISLQSKGFNEGRWSHQLTSPGVSRSGCKSVELTISSGTWFSRTAYLIWRQFW